ncbi:helix-turn-helix domain-containing protein [Rathayibacter caricis]|uniref:AraC family transcriptional regulator n=1 Tax=Rathayibacter caricis TaxID=110936 RepID=UPI001FB28601|nr:AraC family transcriptional regulator [Rathayibacter caricis]MCJ1696818.1 helix-turn-helix domain-containing protein [Rathayibacter caricis]
MREALCLHPKGGTLTVKQPTPPPQRSIVLRDAAAAAWFRERNFEVANPTSLYLAANELRTQGFRFARVWHSAAAITTTSTGENARLLVQVEGESLITSQTLEGTLGPGDIAVLPSHISFSITSTRNVGRYETSFDLGNLSDQIAQRLRNGVVYQQVTSAYRDILLGAGNSALNGRAIPSDKGYAGFRTATTSLVTSMLVEEVESRKPISAPRRESLYFVARQVIIENAADPDFSVTRLAQMLGIRIRRLQEIFSQSGTTPKQAITTERVRRARTLLEHEDGAPALTREAVAGLSGFRDRGALRRALAAHPTTTTEKPGGR